MENQPVTLDQRPGTFDLGKIYEFKMLALLALRCVENSKVKHAWWASNVKDAYDFDDVVLYVEDQNNKRMLYLVQLKHKEKPKSIEDKAFLNTKYQGSNDFSLHKYQKSYFSITSESEKNDLITSIGEADQIYYVLYTNRSLAKNLIFLDVVEQEHKLLDSSETTGNIYKFNSNTQNFNEQFLSNLLLFTKQVHATKIDDLIKMELLRIAGPVKINVNDVSNKYLGFIDAWIKGVKNYKLESLTKKDVTLQLMLFFLEHYILTFPLSQPSRKEFSIWNKIVDESCITVVEASELTHEFLSSYLSVKFSDFCGLDDWEQDVHKDTFYENKPDLKSILMKIVGDTNLTVQKIYHALWSIKKLTLLVEAKTTDDFDNIQRVLRLSKCENYPVIVLSRVEIDEVRNCTFNLSNLNLNLKNSILRYRISFQGRPKACLKDLVDFKMYKLIKCADIIEIISNRFKIGATQTTTRFYIPRQISRVFFTAQELKKIKSKFLLRGVDSTLFEKMFKDKKAKENIIKLDDGLNLNQGSQDYHLLEYVSKNTFKLKHTHNKLETFDTSECWWLPQNETKELFDESVCVVNGHAGIGKTEFLNHIALKAPVNTWVINVNLNAHNDYYKTLKNGKKTVLQHLTYFYGTPNCSNKELEKKVFDLFLKHKNVLVLLDGFDEISMTYMEEVTSIATSLQQDGYKVWITTRPAFKGHLEKALNTMSRTLRSLPFKQQQKFLTQYYKHLATNKTQMLNVIGFVQNLLEAAAKNLNDSQFTGQPLQAKLLADAFEIEVKEVLNNKKIELEDKFDLVFLYERFIEEKIDIACKNLGILKEMREFCGRNCKNSTLYELYFLNTY
ncbi:hypothetical protein FQR65_LT04528 [Abscondita terminalis]|nr:hypothetical protein FQR65_LT04528 [Abscondita terminalis]